MRISYSSNTLNPKYPSPSLILPPVLPSVPPTPYPGPSFTKQYSNPYTKPTNTTTSTELVYTARVRMSAGIPYPNTQTVYTQISVLDPLLQDLLALQPTHDHLLEDFFRFTHATKINDSTKTMLKEHCLGRLKRKRETDVIQSDPKLRRISDDLLTPPTSPRPATFVFKF